MGMVLYQRRGNIFSIHLGENPIIPRVCRETGALHVASLGINTEWGRSELGVCKELQAARGKRICVDISKILSSGSNLFFFF
jgi:hypothetical protein